MHGRIGNWKAKVDVFSLEGLIAWLETMPGDQLYEFRDSRNCGAAQYLKSHGISEFSLPLHELEALGWMKIFNGRDYGRQPNTFSAALTRARAILKDPTP